LKTNKPNRSKTKLSFVGPVVAYGFYVALLIVALIKPTVGQSQIDFRFLTLWGIIIGLGLAVFGSISLIRRKDLKLVLAIISFAVSLVVIFLSVSAIVVILKNQPANYSCNDFIRCLVN
jgi:formate hydrogenlyase subunit 3/multisubunit Na+/H+ antiporter MnhD subunit